MPKKKKRNRKYNPQKHLSAVASFELRAYALTFHRGDPLVEMWHRTQKFRRQIDQMLVDMVSNVKFNWSIYTCVLCRDQLGVQYAQGEWIHTNERYRHDELTEFLNQEHTRILQEANKLHVLNGGWVAIPRGIEMQDAEAIELLELRDCWNYISKWEKEKGIER